MCIRDSSKHIRLTEAGSFASSLRSPRKHFEGGGRHPPVPVFTCRNARCVGEYRSGLIAANKWLRPRVMSTTPAKRDNTRRSCEVCKHRKVKCDRVFPCAPCKKGSFKCAFPVPDRPRAKRTRRLSSSASEPIEADNKVATGLGIRPRPSERDADAKSKLSATDNPRLVLDGDGVRYVNKLSASILQATTET